MRMAQRLAALLRDPRHQIAAVMPSEESCRQLLAALRKQRPDGTYHSGSRRFSLPEGGSVQLTTMAEDLIGLEVTSMVVDELAKPRWAAAVQARVRPMPVCPPKRYDTAEQAKVVAAQMGRKYNAAFAVEPCSYCHKYHVRRVR